MALTEVFTNDATGAVTSGGTTAPTAGTSESWTVTVSIAFPVATSGSTQFYVCDPALPTEKMLVTVAPGGTGAGQSWTVTRGADSTATVAHTSGFTIMQTATHATLANFAQLAIQALFGQSVIPASVALTMGATVATNAALGNHFYGTLSANATFSAPTNATDGQKITYELTQPASGGPYTGTWNAAYDFGTIGAPTLSTTASKTDLVGFVYSSRLAKWMYAGITQGL